MKPRKREALAPVRRFKSITARVREEGLHKGQMVLDEFDKHEVHIYVHMDEKAVNAAGDKAEAILREIDHAQADKGITVIDVLRKYPEEDLANFVMANPGKSEREYKEMIKHWLLPGFKPRVYVERDEAVRKAPKAAYDISRSTFTIIDKGCYDSQTSAAESAKEIAKLIRHQLKSGAFGPENGKGLRIRVKGAFLTRVVGGEKEYYTGCVHVLAKQLANEFKKKGISPEVVVDRIHSINMLADRNTKAYDYEKISNKAPSLRILPD